MSGAKTAGEVAEAVAAVISAAGLQVPANLDEVLAARFADLPDDDGKDDFERGKQAIDAEIRAFGAAGLEPLSASDAQGYHVGADFGQAALYINTQASARTLVCDGLARAERCRSIAGILEVSIDDKDTGDAAYTLARMLEELVDVLTVASTHNTIRNAPFPPAAAAKGGA